MQHGKKYRQASTLVDRDRLHSPLEAVRLARETSPSKFDATVEVAMRLGVDPRKADQMVRGVVNLPHGTGKTARVAVFATGDKAAEAEAAGGVLVTKVNERSSNTEISTGTTLPRWLSVAALYCLQNSMMLTPC